MCKISIIIPVYNAKDYIERCLDSLCNQTLQDIEIICVNDCSNDGSLEILNNYAKKYSNLKVINHDVNGGESKARNTGIENATGEYLAFVDNDDTINSDFLENLYNKAKETHSDIVKGSLHEIAYDGKDIYDNTVNENILKTNCKLFFAFQWWTAIYNRKLINDNNIRFAEGFPLGGDVLFLNKAILSANDVAVVDGTYYNYYRREDSGDSKILTFEKIQSAVNIHEMIVDNVLSLNLDAKYPDGVKYLYEWCLSAVLNYAYRNGELKTLRYCLDRALTIYEKTKNIIRYNLKFNLYQILLDALDKNDLSKLVDLYQKNNTMQKMFCANARYLLVKNKKL